MATKDNEFEINDQNYHLTDEYRDALKNFVNSPTNMYKRANKPLTVNVKTGFGGGSNFRIEDIKRWLQNPKDSEKQLRDLSNYFYNANYLYRWFISILANMPTWDWVLSMDIYGMKKPKDKLEKLYRQGAQFANLKYNKKELNNAFLNALKEDWYFGYELEEDESYSLLKLDPNYCKVTSIYEDGIRGISFDFSYFDDKTDVNGNNIIDTYPDEFKKGYGKYKRTSTKWIPLDPLNTVCWKINDELTYGVPHFASLFDQLNDVGFYKELAKDRAEIDNFLLLHQQIPVDEKSIDKFAINIDLAQKFDAIASAEIPKGASMFTSPMKVSAIKTERGHTDRDLVKDAVDQAFTGAGLPEQLANADTSIGLGKAIEANEHIIYRFYRQVENTINFKMKYKFSGAKLKSRILDITYFSRKDTVKDLLTGAQNGLTPASHVASAMGANPYEFLNDVDMESKILGITDKLKPLLTSHTISSQQQESGAPKKNDTEIADSTTVVRDTDANVNRAE